MRSASTDLSGSMLARWAFRQAETVSLELEGCFNTIGTRSAGCQENRAEGTGSIIAEGVILLVGDILAPDRDIEAIGLIVQAAIPISPT